MILPEYESYDAIGLAEKVSAGELKAEELLEAALDRVKAHNKALNAVVIPMEDEARRFIREDLPTGPLSGVPFLLKDLSLLYTGSLTTNGCRFYRDHVADHDSELVTRYKRAGLVTFGKSASPEFGLTATTESTLYGPTRNPWNLEHSAGGSSGGAAAAVAAGILPVANASDGGGSIRIPASCCGLVGLKPSRGRMPFGPDVGEGWSGMSTIHVVSRSVRDTALMLDLTSGPDTGAPYQAAPPLRPYLEEVSRPPGQLRVGRLAQSFNNFSTHSDCVTAVDDAAKLCVSLGHRVEEVEFSIDVEAMGAASQAITGGNILSILEDYGEATGRVFGDQDVEPFTMILTNAARQKSAADYARAIRTIHKIGRQVERLFERFDVLLSPTMNAPPAKLGVLSLANPDIPEFIDGLNNAIGYTQAFNASGHPAISLPLHWNSAGLPIGIQFAARMGGEGELLQLASQLEQARPWFDRRPPL